MGALPSLGAGGCTLVLLLLLTALLTAFFAAFSRCSCSLSCNRAASPPAQPPAGHTHTQISTQQSDHTHQHTQKWFAHSSARRMCTPAPDSSAGWLSSQDKQLAQLLQTNRIQAGQDHCKGCIRRAPTAPMNGPMSSFPGYFFGSSFT